METILFENDDLEDDNDFIFNKSVVESVLLTISSTAGAVAALDNQTPTKNNNNSDDTSSTKGDQIFDNTQANITTQKPENENLTTQAGILQQQGKFEMTRETSSLEPYNEANI